MIFVASLVLAGCGEPRNDAPAEPTPRPARPTEGEEALGRLDVPDVILTNQRGEPVRLYTDLVAGKVVAMSFIFTRCTTICPPLGLGFSRLRRQLGARAGREVNLISVTLDPLNDTPERLRAWGERFDLGPGWTLLTGDKDDIDRVLKALGVYTAAKEEHSPIVLIGDAARGAWVRAYGLSSPTELAGVVDRMLARAPGTAP
jgi:protein SCO1/2